MNNNKNSLKNKKSKKQKKISKLTNSSNSIKTISGLPASTWISNCIAGAIGLLIFVGAPFIINKTGNTTLGTIMTLCPAGIIMALFISENDYGILIKKLIVCVAILELANFLIYYLFFYRGWSAASTIILIVSIWFFACLIAYFY
jgi:hypothetical protein